MIDLLALMIGHRLAFPYGSLLGGGVAFIQIKKGLPNEMVMLVVAMLLA